MPDRRDLRVRPGAAPVDLDQLGGQTGGDRLLEREVLTMFLSKSLADLDRLEAAETDVARRDAAHMIVGSARAIGAGEVARLAAAVESGSGDRAPQIAALSEAVEAARRFIRKTLDR